MRCYHFFIVEIIDENEFNTDVKIEVVVYGETQDKVSNNNPNTPFYNTHKRKITIPKNSMMEATNTYFPGPLRFCP